MRRVLGMEAKVGACGRINLVGTNRVVDGFGRTLVCFAGEAASVDGVLE